MGANAAYAGDCRADAHPGAYAARLSPVRPEVCAAGLVVEDGLIRRVGPPAELEQQGPDETVVGDPSRHLALPGLVNAHHHDVAVR
jgi:cytosine/adenosine deaminase-related metal-dependent hydrolase